MNSKERNNPFDFNALLRNLFYKKKIRNKKKKNRVKEL